MVFTDTCETDLARDVFLRPASARDARALARLRRASLEELRLLPDPQHEGPFEARAALEFNELFESRRIHAWVLVAAGALTGSASAVHYRRLPYPGNSWHAELAGVYVAPHLRRRGYARELCREVIDAARAAGARKIFVAPSAASRDLYRSLGFREHGMMSL